MILSQCLLDAQPRRPLWACLRNLRLVCRSWNAIIEATGKFWQQITVRDGPLMAELSVRKAVNAGATVEIDYQESVNAGEDAAVVARWNAQSEEAVGFSMSGVGVAFWSRLREHSAHWRAVTIVSRYAQVVSAALSAATPRLQTASIAHPCSEEVVEGTDTTVALERDILAFSESRNMLERLEIEHWTFRWGGAFSRLRTLSVQLQTGRPPLSPAQLLKTLGSCPDLSELYVVRSLREDDMEEDQDEDGGEGRDHGGEEDEDELENEDEDDEEDEDENEPVALPNLTFVDIRHTSLQDDSVSPFSRLLPRLLLPAQATVNMELCNNSHPSFVDWVFSQSHRWKPLDTLTIWPESSAIVIALSEAGDPEDPHMRFEIQEVNEEFNRIGFLEDFLDSLANNARDAISTIQLIFPRDEVEGTWSLIDTLATSLPFAGCLALQFLPGHRIIDLLTTAGYRDDYLFKNLRRLRIRGQEGQTRTEIEEAAEAVLRVRQPRGLAHVHIEA